MPVIPILIALAVLIVFALTARLAWLEGDRHGRIRRRLSPGDRF